MHMHSAENFCGSKKLNSCFLALAVLIVANTSIAMDNGNPFSHPLLKGYALMVGDNARVSISNSSLITEQGYPIEYIEQDRRFICIQRVEGDKKIAVDLTIEQVENACKSRMKQLDPKNHASKTSTAFTGSTSSMPSPNTLQQDNRPFQDVQQNDAAVAKQQSAKLATYSPAITATAAIAGVLAEEAAKRKFEKSKKKAFFAGVGATSVASLIGQRLQQGEHTPGRVFTQVAIDAAVYTAIHHVTNYFFSTAKKQKTDPETAKSSSHNARG